MNIAFFYKILSSYRITYLLFYILVLVSINSKIGLAQKTDFNPKKCHNGTKDKRYIAEGSVVIAIEPSDEMLRGSLQLPVKYQIAPPDPAEQVGCFENPQQFAYFNIRLIAIFPDAQNMLSTSKFKLSSFGIVPLRGYGVAALIRQLPIYAGTWFADNPEFTDWLVREPGTVCEDDQGAVICRSPATRPEPATSITIKTNVYPTPENKPFRVYCGVDAYLTGLSPCKIGSYSIYNKLGIYYSLIPMTSVKEKDIVSRIINIDKNIRRSITDAVVEDYPWPALGLSTTFKERIEQ